ncbi:MAG: hypothetical protein AB1599_09325 [Planctomycetota bacterium]
MSANQLDYLKRTGRHLWRLVVIDNSFKAGSYLLVVSVTLLLVARIFGISFLSESYLLLISPLVGLAGGAVIGIFNKPTMADMAQAIDARTGSNNYLVTAYECSLKPAYNQVEDALVKDISGQGSKALRGFSFRYNWRYFYLFVILSGVFMVVWFTPVAPRQPVADTSRSTVFDRDIITISQGLSWIKQNPATTQEVKEIIRQIEVLIQNIKENRAGKTVVLETINGFMRQVSGTVMPSEESAKLQALLAQLKSLAGDSETVSSGSEPTGAGNGDEFSVYRPSYVVPEPHSGGGQPGLAPEKYSGKNLETSAGIVVKSMEEAINNPYFPQEYKEIVKKYFMEEVDSKQ